MIKRYSNWCAASHGHVMMAKEDGEYFYVQDVRHLLGRCLDALESDRLAAAEKIAGNKGYPAREARYQRWLEDSTALYEEVKALLKD